MIRPEKPDNETQRLATLYRYQVLDTPREQAFDDLVAIASSICNTPMSTVSLIDTDRQWFKAQVGMEHDQSPRDEAFCAHAILEPEHMLIVPDAREDARFRDNPAVTGGPGIRFYAGAPLRAPSDGSALGTLCVMDSVPRELNPQQLQALRALSRQAGYLLDLRAVSRQLSMQLEDREWYEGQLLHYQAQLEAHNADLTEQTRTDPLTGLANRRAFTAALDAAIAAGRACSVALLDLDHFKTVNDVHGHAVGDQVLVDVATQLRAAAGGQGVVARMGGEEFVWLLQDMTPAQAEMLCAYACEAVRGASMALPVTISVGLAQRKPGESPQSLLERADRALYAAKSGGRDRVSVAG